MNVPLEIARRHAQDLMGLLAPYCERIQIAGSIRRGKEMVKDIDLVAIPKMTSKRSLFEPTKVEETEFHDTLATTLRVTADGPRLIRGTILSSAAVSTSAPLMNASMIAPSRSIQVDVYLATAESWATLLLIRTGSAEHNIWMCGRARACGGKLHADGSGLEVPGQYDPIAQRTVNNQVIHAKTEEEIFKAMGLPYAEPGKRECVNGRPVWMPRHGVQGGAA
jgi:DNA polymerase/3'-5' exonuclease PolX